MKGNKLRQSNKANFKKLFDQRGFQESAPTFEINLCSVAFANWKFLMAKEG